MQDFQLKKNTRKRLAAGLRPDPLGPRHPSREKGVGGGGGQGIGERGGGQGVGKGERGRGKDKG